MDEKEKKPGILKTIWNYIRIVLRAMFKVLKVMFMTLFIICVIALLVLVGVGVYKVYPVYKDYKEQVKDVVANSSPQDFRLQEASFIYDANGAVIAKLTGDEDSTYLPFDEIPENAVNAFVAIEDRTFWDNSGIDLKGIIRVGLNYFKTEGEEVHGASTITQQLARNRFLTREVSIERKAKEMLIAMDLTKKYTKEQIMEFYVNDISFANTYYGLQAAARGYFGKDAKDLTLSQTAYVCAIPNSPTYYNPYKHPENAIKRRDKILADMKSLGYINEEEYDEAIREKITVQRMAVDMRNYETTYAIDCAVRFLMRDSGFEFQYGFQSNKEYNDYEARYEEAYNRARDNLYTGGYNIYTSLEPDKQRVLQESIDNVLTFDGTTAANGIFALQGAATVVDNSNNRVVAIVGGRSQETDTYTLNRAFQSPRQPGSTIKPLIVYAPALENGYVPSSSVKNVKVEDAKEKGADIKNLPGNTMPLRQALEQSKNGVAWWLYNEVTPGVGMAYLTEMRFASITPDDYYLSQSLGGFTYGATTEEMAGAYSSLVNGGVYREPTCLVKLVNNQGKDVFKEYPTVRVYRENTAYTMIDMMKGVIKRGTAKAMGWRGDVEAAGKTGTTNNSKDGWFCGVTPYYTMSVWVGYDQPKMLSNLYGATYPASIWKSAMEQLVAGLEPASFPEPGPESGVLGGTAEDYFPNREDSDVLAAGYTVGDYRQDHMLADQAMYLVNQMAGAGYSRRNEMRQQAQALVDQIRGENLKARMSAAVKSGGIGRISVPSSNPNPNPVPVLPQETLPFMPKEEPETEAPKSPAYDTPKAPAGPAAVGPAAEIEGN